MGWIIAGNEQVCLSEQMLLDCGGGSCSGGSLTGGYKVIEKEHGVASQSDYPYSAHEGHCRYESSMKAASISSHEHVDWSIRNSWGGNWGEDGHIRIAMGQNTCNCEETES